MSWVQRMWHKAYQQDYISSRGFRSLHTNVENERVPVSDFEWTFSIIPAFPSSVPSCRFLRNTTELWQPLSLGSEVCLAVPCWFPKCCLPRSWRWVGFEECTWNSRMRLVEWCLLMAIPSMQRRLYMFPSLAKCARCMWPSRVVHNAAGMVMAWTTRRIVATWSISMKMSSSGSHVCWANICHVY